MVPNDSLLIPVADSVYRNLQLDTPEISSAGPSTLSTGMHPSFSEPQVIQFRLNSPDDGIVLKSRADWNTAKFISMDALFEGNHIGMISWQFFARGEKEPRIKTILGFLPGLKTRVTYPLSLLKGDKVFVKRTPGRFKGICFGRSLLPDEISHVVISLEKSDQPQKLFIANLAILKDEPSYPIPDSTVVDELGQWASRDWKGKTGDEQTLIRRLKEAVKQSSSSGFPEKWSKYGGLKELRFKATGFFRTENDGKRWWLVDPDGHAFFSAGLDCVRTEVSSAVLPGTEKLFRWLPPKEGEFKQTWGGGYAQYNWPFLDFGKANLIRTFGKDWFEQWSVLTRGRLIDWRFNTIANWSNLDFARKSQIPYVIPMKEYPTTTTLLFRDLPDVFHPEFVSSAREYAQQLIEFRDDPLLIGYFMNNEPHWGFGKFNLAAEMLEANPGTATRRKFAQWMSEKYGGNVQAWSKAWNRNFDSFAQLETDTFRRIDQSSPAANADLWEFSHLMVRAYVQIPCEEVKKVDPNHLNLGMRYAWIASDVFYSAGEYFDVFSINHYEMVPDFKVIDEIARKSNKPILIGEYHFGALDRGLPSTGLRGVASQEDRGIAYRRYLEQCAAHPALVGAHYFTLNDQAVMGRFDGENFQIGLVDICQNPYPEIISKAIEAHENMYDVRLGRKPAFNTPARETAKIAF